MRAKQPANCGIFVFDPGIDTDNSAHRGSEFVPVASYQPAVLRSDNGQPLDSSQNRREPQPSDQIQRASVSLIRGATHVPDGATVSVAKDHFIIRDGKEFAGAHLIADFWGAKGLTDLAVIENAMREAVAAAGATLLHIHLHHFGEGEGVSGVAVLAESHISVHTWPEREYAAFDVFMCGDARPDVAVEVLRQALQPARSEVTEILRGVV